VLGLSPSVKLADAERDTVAAYDVTLLLTGHIYIIHLVLIYFKS